MGRLVRSLGAARLLRGRHRRVVVRLGLDVWSWPVPLAMAQSWSAALAAGRAPSGGIRVHRSSGSRCEALLFDKGTEFQVLRKEWNSDGYWDIWLKE